MRTHSNTGSAVIEMALVLPLLLFLLLGIFDFGMLFQRYQVLTNATREGARAAAVGLPDAQVVAIVDEYLSAGGIGSGASVLLEPVTIDGPDPVSAVRVEVSYTYGDLLLAPLMSWFGGASPGAMTGFVLRSTATMRKETQG